MIFFEPLNEADREILLGIIRYSRFRGTWTLHIEPSYNCRPQNTSTLRERLVKWGADAIIAKIYTKGELDRLIPPNLPTIINTVADIIPGKPNILNDPIAVLKIAIAHLQERGFRHFAFCGYNDFFSEKYANAFCSILAESGFTSYSYASPNSHLNQIWENEKPLLTQWLHSLPRPVAIMTINDYRAQEVVQACTQTGFHIPNDIAVLGKGDNQFICENSNPPLSSVAFNYVRAGYEAAELLDKMIAGTVKNHTDIYIQPTHVVTRQSTDFLSIKDPDVATALNLIRQHAKEPVCVGNVAELVALSRRTLERKFRQELGYSVLQAIRRIRIDLIAHMLTETDWPISKIAMTVGYTGTENIARYFRQVKGLSPSEFRKRYRTPQ